MAKLDPQVLRHLEWIGFVQPSGLVVSGPALVRAGAILDRQDTEGQRLLRECVEDRALRRGDDPEPWLPDFETFARTVLGWNFSPKGYAGSEENPIPDELQVMTADGETLAPDFAVRDLSAGEGKSAWQLLVQVLEPGQAFDKETKGFGALEASPHSRMERLLRRTEVKAGLLFNGLAIRLISAPRGESSGWMDFRVAEMVQTSGRPICAALRLLLRQSRLLSVPGPQRLAALLEDSRKFQNEVSERLAEQVLHALYEMLRGFQAAHDASDRNLLRQTLAENPDRVYHALLTVLLRLVFLLYAEERDMLPKGEIFQQYYSLVGLYKRLREDAALFPDTMDQRYGAWAQLLVLFRLIHDGGEAGEMSLPRRHGVLFDPDRFPFLEGRPDMVARQIGERIEPPLVSDGTIYRALEKLLVLDGERISYRALDVEQIGSVYETMMGFRLETASGRSVAIKAAKKQGAPTAVDLDAFSEEPGTKREKWLRDRTDRKLGDKVKKVVKEAGTVEDLHAALLPVIEVDATPDLVPRGAMVLQPSEERRRSGSHYTPRELTEPIVRRTLEPILARMQGDGRKPPRPEQILDLKVCDPAMGSGAFLVEACRQLGDALVEAWRAHGEVPEIPPDEDEGIFARRLIAQRCLYGVDRNPMAVDLAKVSLWLVTLARDHALTFVDHALRHGDSLVGLSRKQIEAFHWKATMPFTLGFETMRVRGHVEEVSELRALIREAGEETADWELRDLWDQAQLELDKVRLFGDLAVAAFFDGAKPKEREAKRAEYADAIIGDMAGRYRDWLDERRREEPPLAPFHWEIEFPEVFDRETPGFDSIIGNPPFAGKNTVIAGNVTGYPDWLKQMHEQSHGNADLVAHFFRREFKLVREGGAFGLIATNTIAQGDTRSTGLRWICENGGAIYDATRRYQWPGQAAVVVSVLHVYRGTWEGKRRLDRAEVSDITAFLFHGGGHADPAQLKANAGKSFVGSYVLGMGFTFDDTDKKGIAMPIAEMRRLIEENSRNEEAIFPYIGGEEVNTSPTHAHHRYVINFHDYPLRREKLGNQWVAADKDQHHEWLRRGLVPLDYPGPVAADWPDLLAIVEERAKPERDVQNRKALRERWWHYAEKRPGLYTAITNLERVLAISRLGQQGAFTFLSNHGVFADRLIVFPFDTHAAFCALQSRPHEIWARFFGSSMKDDLLYTPSDCFETFPFPKGWATHPALEAAGEAYYEFRAQLMVANDEGMTKTYNRFHDRYENDPEVAKLRELHAAMDRAVLDAYGWGDISTDCKFLLDYEIDEEEWSNRKKPYRYRWPDDVRDEVLARLLELNAQRPKRETGTKPSFWDDDAAVDEARSGSTAQKSGTKYSPSTRRAPIAAEPTPLWETGSSNKPTEGDTDGRKT